MSVSHIWIVIFLSLRFLVTSASYDENFVSLAEDISCGEIQHLSKAPRIVGGDRAGPGEFPFLASIQRNGKHFCSGFIVKKKVLVTAAHCFIESMHGSTGYKNYEVLVGSNDWKDTTNSTNMFKIDQLLIHPKYSYLKPNVENDIALLTMDRPIDWSSRVQPVCLATKDLAYHYGSLGVIAGWGVRSETGNMIEWMEDTNLHKVALPIWRNVDCQAEYRKHRINWNTKSSHVCAGFQERRRDTCQGDSGSPLILQEGSGKRIAYGIVSVGEGCAAQLPGIYTRISSFIEWIKQNS